MRTSARLVLAMFAAGTLTFTACGGDGLTTEEQRGECIADKYEEYVPRNERADFLADLKAARVGAKDTREAVRRTFRVMDAYPGLASAVIRDCH